MAAWLRCPSCQEVYEYDPLYAGARLPDGTAYSEYPCLDCWSGSDEPRAPGERIP